MRGIFKYKDGDVVITNTSNLKILKCFRSSKSNLKTYKYECLTCGNIDSILEGNLNKKKGCNVCCIPTKKILVGFNDLWSTHPEVAKLLKNADIGYSITHGTHSRQDFICPNCNNEVKNKQIPNVITYGLSCPKCSDKLSYPEKFVFNILYQLGIDFEQQKIFNWLEGKRYDFFIPRINCIIEVHGNQHYGLGFYKLNGQSLEIIQENDKLKEKNAKINGIDHYVVIDCSRSEFDFVKNSILNSELNKLFNFDTINWLKCHEYGCGTLVKVASELWNKGNDVNEICKIMKIKSGTTVRKYLKNGKELEWCDYDSRKVMEKVGKSSNDNKRKPVIRLSLDGTYIDEFKSKTFASKITNIYLCGITQVCEGKRDSVKGYKFMYKEDYDKLVLSTYKI